MFTRRQWFGIAAASVCYAAPEPLAGKWQRIASDTDGTVGAAVLQFGSGQTVAINGQERFPLASVCKLPIGMHILAMVDRGELMLDDEIEILPRDVWPSWRGDLGSRWPHQRRVRLGELLRLMLVHSDNTAVQVLFRIGGESKGVRESLRKWSIRGIRVDRYEGQCSLALRREGVRRFLADPRDTATPDATVRLLTGAFQGRFLSPHSTSLLIRLMESTTTGEKRLKGLLPPSVVVAHKTGTTATINGLNAATNDARVIMLREADRLAIAVCIKASTRDAAMRDRIIARIARAAFDYFAA